MTRGISDPDWKSGPPEPKHSHSEHQIHPEDAVFDFDGPSVEEVEAVDGTICTTVVESMGCSRDGCNAEIYHSHCYTIESVSDRVQQVLLYAVDFDDVTITDDVIVEYIAKNTVIVDYDETPIIGFQFDDDNTYNRPEMSHSHPDDKDVLGYVYPVRTFTDNTATGACHGRADPPSHEPYGL